MPHRSKAPKLKDVHEFQTNKPWVRSGLYSAIIVSLLAVFLADYLTKSGIAVWVLYLVPLSLSLMVWRPSTPLIVASFATLFIFISFYLDARGIDSDIVQLNRGMGLVSIWGMALISYFFIVNKLAIRRQEWLQAGEAQLSMHMNGEQSNQELGENIISFLCEFLHASAGAIYFREAEGYIRTSSYGAPKNSTPDQFLLSDGLLGQAAKDKRSFHLEDVPNDYLAVGSAFGESKPRELFIAPALADGKVNAVFELGFMHEMHEATPEFAQRVSEAIAIAVRAAKYRTDLQEYLAETQRQAEELQAQSEELRVANEELEEQSRALQESQSRLEEQQAELEQTNSQLEEQTQMLETQRDDLNITKNELQVRARELEQASQYKSDFLANMSHELRTPLNSTLILAKLLAENANDNLTDEQIDYANTIYSAGNDLLVLINDILDLSKIEAGHMEIQPEATQLSEMVHNISRIFEPLANEKKLDFSTDIAKTCPKSLYTDSTRVEQVLKNLLSNAIKFTEKGAVSLKVRKKGKDQLTFEVKDSGIGIKEEQQETIFEAFRQADGTSNRKYGGTGLGLSITRELTRLLGGDIALESEPGKGSTFIITLPITYDASQVKSRQTPGETGITEQTDESVKPARQKGKLPAAGQQNEQDVIPHTDDDRDKLNDSQKIILIVEDDESFARIIYDLAHEMDFQCLIAHTADDAIRMARHYLPHAMILDIGLPDHSGLSVLDRLKQDASTRHIPVHVVSGNDYSQTALALGAVGYMFKPVKREQLMDSLKQVETKLTQSMRRVLLVEDDPVQQKSLKKLLGTKDVETVAVGTAADCLKKLKKETFDCMVLDISLPDASGYSLLETLSKEEAYSFPPVIVYTGHDLSQKEEEKLRRYSKSIIIKGAKSPERLLDEVTLFLHQVVADLPAEHQRMLKKAKNRDTILEGRRILVVEDDIRNVYALTSIFEPRGATIQIARNGVEALEALKKAKANDNQSAIDLVLMDVMMPEMDGITATREIRKQKLWNKLPIIMLTAKAMKGDQERCLEAGANDYMSKPLDVEKLLSLVRVWMPR